VDALTHAVEAIASRMRHPFGNALATEAARIILADDGLARCLEEPDDLAARGRMLTAAALAGQAINSCMLGACHAFAHALGAHKGVPHGVANGVFLVPTMKLNREKARSVYARLGAALGGTGDEPALAGFAMARVEDLVHDVAGIPRKLSELGVEESDLERLTELVMTDADLATNPVQITEPEHVTELLRSLL
jgi:alcohol dehydrogenase class IV